MESKISVIIPVYKVEQYLDKCVQSIVDQTYSNLEIVLVDDGSPDNCPAMCDAWAKRDKRIHVIHKENGGGAQARNVGLDRCTGDYIGFVDSDDFILPDMYSELMRAMTEYSCDIVECGYSVTSDGSVQPETEKGEEPIVLNTVEALKLHIRDIKCRQIVWNKLYKRQVIGQERFIEGKQIDDEFFTYKILGNAQRIAVLSSKMYCYRQQGSSVMHQRYSLNRLVAVEAKERRLEYIKEKCPELESEAKLSVITTCIYQGQMSLIYLPRADRKQAMRTLRGTVAKYPLKHSEYADRKINQRVWLDLTQISFNMTCGLRNLFGIGK